MTMNRIRDERYRYRYIVLFLFSCFPHFFVQAFLPPRSTAPVRILGGPCKSATNFNCNLGTRRLQYRRENDDSGSSSAKELTWNVVNLLKYGWKGKEGYPKSSSNFANLEPLLMDVYHAAIEARPLDDDSTVVNVHDQSPTPTPPKPLPEHLASIRRFMLTSDIDLEHEGRFRVFDDCIDHKTSIPSNLLFSMDHPLTFIRKHLSYQSNETKKGGMLCDNSEAVVWCMQNEQNLEYASRVLDDMPLAQLHMGSFSDCQVELDLKTIRALESFGVLKGDTVNEYSAYGKTSLCSLKGQDLDIIRSLLSCHTKSNSKNTQIEPSIELQGQQSLIKLIDNAVESVRKDLLGNSNEPHLVIVAHSTNALMVASALSTWKQQKLANTSARRLHVEDLLHQAVTIVTVGAVYRNFCDGPAYIHISMYDDDLAQTLGVTIKSPDGGGRDAVYLHAWSPYEERKKECTNLTDHDSHNVNACAIQYLCLVMRINGITSFRDLYNAARYVDPRSILDINPSNFAIDYTKHKQGDLVIPPNIDEELLPAMIRATGGDQWLWNPMREDQGDDVTSEVLLPDAEEAKVYLEEFFGYSAFEEICEVCCNNIV